ncbi:MAG: NAD-dependent epimerase/dehydratase family protein [Kineosporiaceae bacterium]|nr:NAD-dependent epimerase/dehydratase family protein [Aeromicrobium sp.]
MDEDVKTWVIGAGGLIGSAIVQTSGIRAFESAKIPWATADAPTVLRNELDRFLDWVGNDKWGIVWAAGVGVMHTDQSSLDVEIATFGAFCARTSEAFPPNQGGLYVVSSAGGLYAGSENPPFGVDTQPHPSNAYGRSKLEQERIAVKALSSRIPVTIGRLSNVYGPGQNLSKQQGLVTQLGLCSVLNKPATIFAPLSTLRDYIFAADAARAVAADVCQMARACEPSVLQKIVCSGRSTSIAELIAIVEKTTGRTIPVIHSLTDRPYVIDLRLKGPPHSPVTDMSATPLEVGVSIVFQDLLSQLADGRLAHLG